eukprot:2636641-Pyramimonas_sp.AAC.1
MFRPPLPRLVQVAAVYYGMVDGAFVHNAHAISQQAKQRRIAAALLRMRPTPVLTQDSIN